MTNYQDEAVSPSGIVVPNAQVTVFNTGLSSKPTIYSDAGTTPLTNPFQADAQGRFKFYAANGKYDVQVSGPGIVTQTRTDVLINDDPLLVGRVNLTSQIAAIAPTPVYTPIASNFYRATALVVVTTTGNAVAISPQVTYTDADSGAFETLTYTATTANDGPGGQANSIQHFQAAAGQAISYLVTLGGNIGAGVYSFYFRLEQL